MQLSVAPSIKVLRGWGFPRGVTKWEWDFRGFRLGGAAKTFCLLLASTLVGQLFRFWCCRR